MSPAGISAAAGMAVLLAAHLLLGVALGLIYFGSVWWSARRLVAGAAIGTVLALVFVRMAVLAAVLVGFGLEGAAPLLAGAAGVLLARHLMMRRVRRSAP